MRSHIPVIWETLSNITATAKTAMKPLFIQEESESMQFMDEQQYHGNACRKAILMCRFVTVLKHFKMKI